MRNFLVGLAVAAIDILSARPFVSKPSDYSQRLVLNEENVVIDVAEKVSPSVVTVAIKESRAVAMPFFLGASGLETETIQRDIGTGFIAGVDGLIVTNKHVVSDLTAAYKVITKDNTEYEVKNIYRDPVSDLAMVRIEPIAGKNLLAAVLGDSSGLKVGQFVIAIGTALGEFRHTVTTGVISGLGRGITAGNGYSVGEQLDDVIQTDAAINPGNSG